MPNDELEGLNSRPPGDSGNQQRKIPREAYELLRDVPVPYGFKAVVRNVVRPMSMTTSAAVEGTPTSPWIGMISTEKPIPKVPVQPEKMPGPPISVSRAETGRASIELPNTEIPIEPEEDFTWIEESNWTEEAEELVEWPDEEAFIEQEWDIPDEPAIEDTDEYTEEEPPDDGIQPLTLTNMTLNQTDVMHWTPGLHTIEGLSLSGLVTNTYPAFNWAGGEFFPGEDDGEYPGEEDDGEYPGEEIAFNSCNRCQLILIVGKSLGTNDSKKIVVSDTAIGSAHDAAVQHIQTQMSRGNCVRLVHIGWKSGLDTKHKSDTIYRHVYAKKRGAKTKTWHWKLTKRTITGKGLSPARNIKKWLEKSRKNKIDCYDVLAIYHGASKMRTTQVLQWLEDHCTAPIRNLYLWSCWGSEQIDVNDAVTQNFKRAMDKKRVDADNDNTLCPCKLCVYTAPFLTKKAVQKYLQDEIDKWKNEPDKIKQAQPSESTYRTKQLEDAAKKLALAKKAKSNVDNSPNTEYAAPLSIKPIKKGDTDFVLWAIGKEMFEYCPLKDKGNKPVRKTMNETLPGVPVQDLEKKNIADLIVKSISRAEKAKKE